MWIRITEACLEMSQCRYREGSTWKEIVSICGPLPRDLIGVIWIQGRSAIASPEISIILPYRAGWGNQSGITEDRIWWLDRVDSLFPDGPVRI